MKFFSQFGEDKWIFENLNPPQYGYFVEVGLDDSVQSSNTFFFERQGWRGIGIEPDPRNSVKVASLRKCAIDKRAAGKMPGVAGFTVHASTALSGLIRPVEQGCSRVQVVVETLTKILDDHQSPARIDLLSIDTEGTELDVWAGLDLTKYRPQIVVIEYDTLGICRDPDGVATTIQKDGYRLVHTTQCNLILENIR